jgi:putative glutamine amidotransferase
MSPTFPLIGIPCRADTSGSYPGRPIMAQNSSYLKAIIQAGGLPILIPLEIDGPMLEQLFDQVDGLVFSGGGDIDPAFYDETPQVDNLDHIQDRRDQVELTLMQLAMDRQKPFFAICRGIQVMNVARGGSLWQDLTGQKPDAMRHDYYYDDRRFARNYIAHEVTLEKTSLLGDILGIDRLPVNSLHHQAVKDIPASLKATGYADDGVIEALEAPGHPFGLGVQWHPEELVAEHETAGKMFRAFVEAAGHHHRNGRSPNS